ncbi:MAG: chitobiase/beta-hexosaminidase C-terminal domain-containing protein [Ignavibacteriae bacterium]|nr:chitobiase/beta-hexosaminidase C-terminal domain-containing protein [Ignavibacteriota bacterium]
MKNILLFFVILISLTCCSENPTIFDGATLNEKGIRLSNGCLIPIEDGARSFNISGECNGIEYNFSFYLITWENGSVIGYIVKSGDKIEIFGTPSLRINYVYESGNYVFHPVSLCLQSETVPFDINIFYSIDGSEPSNTKGIKYNTPIDIDNNTTVKAIAITSIGIKSDIITLDYKFPIEYITSYNLDPIPEDLVTDGKNLWFLSEKKLIEIDNNRQQKKIIGLNVDEFNEHSVDGLAWDGLNFWISHNTVGYKNFISKIDNNGNIIKTIDCNRAFIYDFTIYNDSIYALSSHSSWGLDIDDMVVYDTNGRLIRYEDLSLKLNTPGGIYDDKIRFTINSNKTFYFVNSNFAESGYYHHFSSSIRNDFLVLNRKNDNINESICLNNYNCVDNTYFGFLDIIGNQLQENIYGTICPITIDDNNNLWIVTPNHNKNFHKFKIN